MSPLTRDRFSHQNAQKLSGGRGLYSPDRLAGCKGWAPGEGIKEEEHERRKGGREAGLTPAISETLLRWCKEVCRWSPRAVGPAKWKHSVTDELREHRAGESFDLDGESSRHRVPVVVAYTTAQWVVTSRTGVALLVSRDVQVLTGVAREVCIHTTHMIVRFTTLFVRSRYFGLRPFYYWVDSINSRTWT